MQELFVNVALIAALVFLGRRAYKSFAASRRAKTPACPGCGSCEAAKPESPDPALR